MLRLEITGSVVPLPRLLHDSMEFFTDDLEVMSSKLMITLDSMSIQSYQLAINQGISDLSRINICKIKRDPVKAEKAIFAPEVGLTGPILLS